MKHSSKIIVFVSFLILTIFIGGCGFMNKDDSKETEIKQNFNKTLSMYPIKNLENFYDKEGYRDEEFDKKDKGTWIVHSEMTIEPKGKSMETRGMVLYINRNTRTTKGYYFINEITDDSNGRPKDDEKRYPVKMEHNKIIPTKQAPKLLLKGDGDLKGSSVGSKNLEFTFVENKEENIFFTDAVQFTPSEDDES
ncbi:tandem-type lipoprotein [Staphylococcus epidermidis]|nr:tandem-type lipoprotein [Staphylococcus epidermidis]